MTADPIIYCLEHLTDYDQFERLCHDIMALEGFHRIEPLGGSKDKGRDAILVDSTGGATIFAFSVREDWQKKLREDSAKIKKHGHSCNRLVFLSTSKFTASERDAAIEDQKKLHTWNLELYGIERLAGLLRSTHAQLVAKHPSIFCPPFFPRAGGLSLSICLDHLIIDHIDTDTALAHWLTRRLTLDGFQVWCRGLAPIAGSSIPETIRELLNSRAFRYICILSSKSVSDREFTSRRLIAHAVGMQRNESIVIPAISTWLDPNDLDQDTRSLACARFDQSWAKGLNEIEEALLATACPRKPDGALELALHSYFPTDILLNEPETIACNLFQVTQFPQAILRFHSTKPLEDDDGPVAGKWGFRKVTPNDFLSFHRPPGALVQELGIIDKGGSVWNVQREFDGIRVEDLIKELIKKSLYAECRKLGLCYCQDTNMFYFPAGLLKNNILKFKTLDKESNHFSVVGERSFGSSSKYRYSISPVFVPSGDTTSGFDIIVRIRVRITDTLNKPFPGRSNNSRRKKLCKGWWNWEWLCRTMGVMQFLAGENDRIEIGNSGVNRLIIERFPRTWITPVQINEKALGDSKSLIDEEIFAREEEDEDDAEK